MAIAHRLRLVPVPQLTTETLRRTTLEHFSVGKPKEPAHVRVPFRAKPYYAMVGTRIVKRDFLETWVCACVDAQGQIACGLCGLGSVN